MSLLLLSLTGVPDGQVVVVVMNRNDKDIDFKLADANTNRTTPLLQLPQCIMHVKYI
jgi:hypothetical protein